jgi:hypothetical protein
MVEVDNPEPPSEIRGEQVVPHLVIDVGRNGPDELDHPIVG